MPYQAPISELRFVLEEVLDIETLAALPGYQEATPDLLFHVLAEAAKLAETVLFPLNRSGDREGCHLDSGAVRTPAGFRAAYETYRQGGWIGLDSDPAFGGQGLPSVLRFAVDELMCAANLSFTTYPGLTQGAAHALYLHGAEPLKARFLPKLLDGSWAGTMCLTEAQCGTDLGLIRTRAVPDADGSYRISGSKIFISAGDHNLTENILHLVLARLPDGPPGIKGISLFLVPKRLVQADGSLGVPNGVVTQSLEHKMGLQASSTCTLVFEDARGWLVGPPHKGMRAMFSMMNAARLAVGVQGLGVAEVAFQEARAYARQRLQGRAPAGPVAPDLPADPLIAHPDIRRMLLTMKAWIEGGRALALSTGLALDRSRRAPDAAVRQEADDLVALMTPVIKSLLTDIGVEAANLAVQIYGGHGYVRDHGIEQYARDVRITQIYEGTNGIQALDLVGRKLGQDYGRLLRRFCHPAQAAIEAARRDASLAPLAEPLAKAFERLQQVSLLVASRGLADATEAAAAATDYLRLFGLVAVGVQWLGMAEAAGRALRRPDAAGQPERFYRTKLAVADFYMRKLLPEVHALAARIHAGAAPLMAVDAEAI